MDSRSRLAGWSCALLAACSVEESAVVEPECSAMVSLDVRPDPSPDAEAYVCTSFDASALSGLGIRSIRWRPPPSGGVALHHATLFALSEPLADGPCLAMPANALALHTWAPGAEPLLLPDSTGVLLPEKTTHLAVQAHVLRTASEPAETATATICASSVERVAEYGGMSAPVPAIRPHHVESSGVTCRLEDDTKILAAWPHMHRIGREIRLSKLDAEGNAQALVEVLPWSFDRQLVYRLDVPVAAGDRLALSCVWENTSDEYVLPGPHTDDEMCNAGLIVSPPALLVCDGP